jgi:hypothetical protein
VNKAFLIFGFWFIFIQSFTQQVKVEDKANTPFTFTGSLQLTSNGISTIPAYSLGKPALMVNLSASKKRFSLNPVSAFSLDGKPWYVVTWLRYNAVNKEKIILRTSTAWSLAFRDAETISNDDTLTIRRAYRNVFLEIRPTYFFTQKTSLAMAYMYAHGIEKDNPANIHCITLNGMFTGITLAKNVTCTLSPQLFYVYFVDKGQGTFFSASVSFAHQKVPLSVGALITQPLESTLEPKSGFVWNVSLTYSFK